MSYDSFAAFYDKLQIADYEKIGAYYRKRLKENKSDVNGNILLDLACGTGRLSRYFSGHGYDVIGADISPEMLSEAVKKPHENIQYLCQDMTRLDLYGTIDCCICALDGINHLPDLKAVKKAFSRVSLFMNKGGVFAFDVNTLYKHKKILSGNTFVYDMEELYCVWRNSACAHGKIDITLDIFAREGNAWQRYNENFSERAYRISEIMTALESADFGEIRVYDWLSDNHAGEESEKAVFTAIKL